ncbi:MAG: DHA2 family efflux MFS transporter permease subunit [Alicyclobacillaceae bacterium]|nr:DHA2 family efflux MFS transporter permease subunit [Alicyclobacillaceae bacterium]
MNREPAAPAAQSDGSHWLSLIVVILGAFVAILNNSLINVALPQLMNVFGASTDEIQWVLTGFMLASGIVVPVSGYVGDRYGYKKSYIGSILVFVVASLLCAFAWNTESLIAFRVIQGLGGGLLMPLSMSIVYKVVPRHQIGLALGIWGIAAMVAPAVGPTLSGYLIEYFSWRLLFLLNVPVGVLAVICALFLLRETETDQSLAFDRLGFVLSTVGLGALLLALSKGHTEGWTSQYIVNLFVISFFALALLVWVETGRREPLLDITLLKNPVFLISTITSSLVMIGLYGGIFLTPLYLQNIQGLSAVQTGLLLMPQALAMALMMPLAGRLFDKIGPVPLGLLGVGILSAMTYELHRLTLDTPNHWLRWVLVIRGIGIGLSMMPLTTSGMNAVRPDQIGRASALGNVIRQVAASFGIAVLTTILQQRQALQGARIAESVTVDSGAAAQTQAALAAALAQGGVDPATAQGGALELLGLLVQKEAAVRAIADTFLFSSVPLFLALPLIVFLRAKKPAQATAGGSRPPVPQGARE